MPPRIPDHRRQEIADAIRKIGKRNEVARQFGIGLGTVSAIAREFGIDGAFDRTEQENATKARLADNKARRSELQELFLVEAKRALQELHEPHLAFSFGGRENTYNEHLLDEPSTADKRNLMIIAATALDKSIVIDRHDADDGADGARSMLGALANGLQVAYEQMQPEAPADTLAE